MSTCRNFTRELLSYNYEKFQHAMIINTYYYYCNYEYLIHLLYYKYLFSKLEQFQTDKL